jgi:hypothetical protein
VFILSAILSFTFDWYRVRIPDVTIFFLSPGKPPKSHLNVGNRYSSQPSEITSHVFPTIKVKQSRYMPWRRSYSFSTSALDGGEWSASSPGRAFTPGERTPGTRCTGGWVGPRGDLDTEARGKILCFCRGSNTRSPGRPARSQTLYCLSYPAPNFLTIYYVTRPQII